MKMIKLISLLMVVLVLLMSVSVMSPVTSFAASGEIAYVDFNTNQGAVNYMASGFLHGFTNDGTEPPDSLVKPLKIQWHRAEPHAVISQKDRMAANNINSISVISDAWRYTVAKPGYGGDWTTWENFVVSLVNQNVSAGIHPAYDIWNEPDMGTSFDFNQAFMLAYKKIRQTDPQAKVMGPSYANVKPGSTTFNSFIDYCIANNCVPDIWSWHFPSNYKQEVSSLKTYLQQRNINTCVININEYIPPANDHAGGNAWDMAQLQYSGADAGCHALWSDWQNLDNLIFKNGSTFLKRGRWWVYQKYASMTGTLVTTTDSADISCIAAKDSPTKTATVLVGNKGGATGNNTICFNNMSSSYAMNGSKVHVKVECIPENNGNEVTGTTVLTDADYTVSNNQLNVVINMANAQDAYFITITPNRVLNIQSTSSTITVNGNLNESAWSLNNKASKVVLGADTNTVTFGSTWNNTYLYVGVKVLDANLYNDSTNWYDDDAVEIYIDPTNNKATSYDSQDRQFSIRYNDTTLREAHNNTAGVVYAQAAITGGYCIELAIPWSNLGITPTNNMRIGFDIGNDEDTNGTTRDGQLVWNGTVNNFMDTSAFGECVLTTSIPTTLPPTPPTPPTNYVINPGFETGTFSNWYISGDTTTATLLTDGGYGGAYMARVYKSAASYDCCIFQTITGLTNGTYTLKAWVSSSGGQNYAQIEAKNYGGSLLAATIPAGTWRQITINNINVTNGQCLIDLWVNDNGNHWVYIDNVTLTKN